MELPPYHAPRPLAVIRLAERRLRIFAVRAGITITVVVTILAGLNSLGTDGSFGNQDTDRSILAATGRVITPVFTPMGITRDNWPATVGLFTGMFAKEAIVGTLTTIYTQEDRAVDQGMENGETDGRDALDVAGGLREALSTIPENLSGLVGARLFSVEEDPELDRSIFGRMRSRFDPAAGYAYLLFVLIYFPCVAALGAAIQEMGRGYGMLLALYLTVLAWVVAVLFYQFATGPAVGPLLAVAALSAGMFALLRIVAARAPMDRAGTGAIH
jgi:ferrous iron transport protein B